MQRRAATADPRSVSDFLSGVKLRGQGWCYTDLGEQTGFSVPPSDGAVLHAVLHGGMRLACHGGEVIELGPGSAVMVLSGEAHALRTSAASPAPGHPFLREPASADVPPTVSFAAGGSVIAHMLSGRLGVDWPGEVDRASLPALLHVGPAQGSPTGLLLRPEALALAGMGVGSAALLTSLAALMLVAALRADPRCRRIFAPARPDPIGEAMRLIESRPAANWTVERLARAVGMGRSNFAAHFTREVGRAPMEMVVEHRMRQAAALLRDGKLKIAEIGESVGYGSEAAFSRRFTSHFGITPSRMREEARIATRDAAPAPAPKGLLGGRMAKDAPGAGRATPPASAPARAPSSGRSLLLLGSNRPKGR